ncbi:formimidoyltransferase-cyclodeaminase [Folsomia candida]|uniref:formimidoyltransferase-cyclodeaminase n=1 Tax=Folsomia candida TaxID=158441 RepID=UPI000B8F21E1|nr:formimidoyltransferase-cyclodeaminase [Folsomia candida]
MDAPLIECVPNFSEGQDAKVLDTISDAIKATAGVTLLGVDPGKSTNRSVYTFVGCPDSVVEAALNAAKAAYGIINMKNHKGEHPRLGAMDVCPFVPVRNATMEDCVKCAKRLGSRLAEELAIPIYLYGFAAGAEYRRAVPQIRAGEYEGIEKKITKEEWKPDFGPASFVPSWGASMVGARKFLLAYNVNILSTKEQAHRIALDLRENGRGPGKEGKLKAVQGIGWWLDEANLAQISYNITDSEITSLHTVFEESKAIAESLNLSVVGSELVGLVPLSALLDAANFYIQRENLMILDDDQKVKLAIDRLGLNSLYSFDPKERIIEWKVESSDPPKPLLDLRLTQFIKEVRARTAAPGGGSVAAVVGALGAALGSMVGLLTYGKKQWEEFDSTMRDIIPPLYGGVDHLLRFVEADTNAFNKYVEAIRQTKNAESDVAQTALLNAINVPMELERKLASLWSVLETISKIGNPNCISDVQVAVKCVETGIYGARCNVIINCKSLTDANLRKSLIQEANSLYKEAQQKCQQILDDIETRSEA